MIWSNELVKEIISLLNLISVGISCIGLVFLILWKNFTFPRNSTRQKEVFISKWKSCYSWQKLEETKDSSDLVCRWEEWQWKLSVWFHFSYITIYFSPNYLNIFFVWLPIMICALEEEKSKQRLSLKKINNH